MKNQALYFVKPNQVTILEEPVPTPKEDEVIVKNFISGISAGTEMLFYRGLMPTDLALDETIHSLQGSAKYPFKYGYCSVGKVIETNNSRLKHLLDQWVFAFNPHESYFCAKEQQLILLPKNISPYDALFIPSMETAINLILDGSPLIGENVLVFGLGIVGLLTAALLKQFPLDTLIAIDLYQNRLKLCDELGVELTLNARSDDLESELKNYSAAIKHNNIDLIYELTGNPEALNSAITFASYEGRIVLGSWYGKKPCFIDLGGKFHRQRVKIIASQVSTIASELHGRWSKDRRFDLAFKMIDKIKPARFISHQFNIKDADKAYQLLQSNPNETLQISLTYEA